MSEFVIFDDLGLLDGSDLRAVFAQVPPVQVLDALVGASANQRHRLLTKLPASTSTKLRTLIEVHGPVSFEAVHDAQGAVVNALRRLARNGQIAFDDPEDMVA